ncbi:MAG TPA: hypothetical protein VF807_11670 [Ktedonobacterales bacterium]
MRAEPFDASTALDWLEGRARGLDALRLAYLTMRQAPSDEEIRRQLADQRSDGGFAPPWAPNYSGLDATCFRLARLKQAGVLPHVAPLAPAVTFLSGRQQLDGSWREEPPSGWLPPWLARENPAALAYLTANCGYLVCQLDFGQDAGDRAARALASLMGPAMREAAPLQTLAQSAVILHATRHDASSHAMLEALARRLVEATSAGALSWSLVALVDAGEWVERSLISTLCAYLIQAQHNDGSWSSEDGPDAAVHVTLEALWGLRMADLW